MTALFSYIAGIFAAVSLLAVPTPAAALGFTSFGGRVILESICLNGAIDVTVLPAGIFPAPPYSYVYLPTTATFRGILPTPATPPLPGQTIMGTALPIPVPCVGIGLHPPVYYGFPMLTEAVSTGITSVLTGIGLY